MKYLPIVFLVSVVGLCAGTSAATSANLRSPQQRTSTATAAAPQSVDDLVAAACHRDQVKGDARKEAAFAACARGQTKAFNLHLSIQIALSKLNDEDSTALGTFCKVKEAGWDVSNLTAALTCVNKGPTQMEAARFQFLNQKLDAITEAMSKPNFALHPTPPLAGAERHTPTPQPASAGQGAQTPKPGSAVTYEPGRHVGSSALRTKSTCKLSVAEATSNGQVTSDPDIIGVRRSLLAPKEASDIYGHRLGKRYIVYQVRVSNFSKDFQYVVHDISVNLRPLYKDQDTPVQVFQASSRELSFLRGVTEKGQDLDPRNITLHTFQGLGSVASGVSGLTPFSDVMGSAVGEFSGPFVQAFVGMFPDHTPTQLNRLSDEAFASNTLVDKLHTKVYAIFLPEAVLFNESHQKEYWSNPHKFLEANPLDQLDVCVDGSLVTEANVTPEPEFSLDAGNIAPGASLTLSDGDTGATIHYTVDGSTPTTNSTKYTAPFALSSTFDEVQTVQAIAVAANQTTSAVVTRVYAIKAAAPKPVFTPTPANEPTGGDAFSVQIALDASQPIGTIYFTTDGTDPTTASKAYSGPISVTAPKTVKAIAIGQNNSASAVAEADYK